MTRVEAAHNLRFGDTVSKSFIGSKLTPLAPHKTYDHTFRATLCVSAREGRPILLKFVSDVFPPEKPISITLKQTIGAIRRWFPRHEK